MVLPPVFLKNEISGLKSGKIPVYYLHIKIRMSSESRAIRELSRNCECAMSAHESDPGLLIAAINLNNLCERHKEKCKMKKRPFTSEKSPRTVRFTLIGRYEV